MLRMTGTGLRLVAWNCNGGFRRKHSVIRELQPDIAIISETSEDFARGIGVPQSSSLWIGGETRRGLGVLALNGWSLAPADLDVGLRLYLPCVATRGSDRIQVVAVCAKKARGYVSPTLEALRQLSDFIRAGPTICAGDFNGSASLDRKPPFKLVPDVLALLNMRSAWHRFHGENFGEESASTFFRHFKNDPDKRFHIDYAFVPEAFEIEDTKIGTYADYAGRKLSDHAPLSVDLRLPSHGPLLADRDPR